MSFNIGRACAMEMLLLGQKDKIQSLRHFETTCRTFRSPIIIIVETAAA